MSVTYHYIPQRYNDLPNSLTCGNDFCFALNRKNFLHCKVLINDFIKCIFEKESIEELELILSSNQLSFLCLKDILNTKYSINESNKNVIVKINKKDINGK